MKRGPTCRTACPTCGLSFSICGKGTASEVGRRDLCFPLRFKSLLWKGRREIKGKEPISSRRERKEERMKKNMK